MQIIDGINIYRNKAKLLVENLELFKDNLRHFVFNIKQKNIRNISNLFETLNTIIKENIKTYKDILEYMLDIYRFIYNIDNTDFRIFEKNEQKTDGNFEITNYQRNNDCGNNFCASQIINDVTSLDSIHRTKTKFQLEVPYFLDFQINLLDVYIKTECFEYGEKLIKNRSINDNYFKRINENFIQSRFFFAQIDEDLCRLMDQKNQDKNQFEIFFPSNNRFSNLYHEKYFKKKFIENLLSFENTILSLINSVSKSKNMEFGIKKIRDYKNLEKTSFSYTIHGKRRYFSCKNVQNYEHLFIIKLLLDHSDE